MISKTILWCWPNNTFVKVMDFVTTFESQKMTFGPHQSTTYENSHKMPTSEVVLWCQPNNIFMKIINFVNIFKPQKMSFVWPTPEHHL